MIASLLKGIIGNLLAKDGDPDDEPMGHLAIVPQEVSDQMAATPGAVLRVRFEVVVPGGSPDEDIVTFFVSENAEVH